MLKVHLRKATIALLISGSLLALPAAAQSRTFRWSGYTWNTFAANQRFPGPNNYSASKSNVSVQRDGSLKLDYTNRKAVEVGGPRLGYGHYRWIVASDVTNIGTHDVLAMFMHNTRKRTTVGEHDIEFARWGSLVPPIGWYVSWGRTGRENFGNWAVSPSPPYTVDITWRRNTGFVQYDVTDAAGTPLLHQTVAVNVGGSDMGPYMSYWLWAGNKWTPRTSGVVRSPHPALIIRDFSFSR
jgi:hypothetical protein